MSIEYVLQDVYRHTYQLHYYHFFTPVYHQCGNYELLQKDPIGLHVR